ncbi:hypothetical protein [Paraburkholderia sp. Ac-20336]|nr:hypothetical protein [Paraburkholderia sp. Ac-20336]
MSPQPPVITISIDSIVHAGCINSFASIPVTRRLPHLSRDEIA